VRHQFAEHLGSSHDIAFFRTENALR
jgi:hypothetical protein